MVAIIANDKDKEVKRGVAVKADGLSRCPRDQCIEVERQFKHGGTTIKKGEKYLNWEMYNADRKQGGCGTSWTVDTPQGVQEAEQQGRAKPRWVNEAAATGRSYSMPSEAFSDAYERIFGHS